MLDLIICANFGVENLRGLGNTRGQILEFPIEMAGHPYNRAGATAQPVIGARCRLANMTMSQFNTTYLLIAKTPELFEICQKIGLSQ